MNPDAFGPDLIGAVVGFVFTIFVFSYIFGDNVLFRLALYIFIGVAAGFATVIVFYNVILYQMIWPLITEPGRSLAVIPPLFFGILLLVTKSSPRLARLGAPMMGYLVGAAAATAVGGVVLGTLFPQVGASARLFDLSAAQTVSDRIEMLFRGVFILIGTITTLAYFQFTARAKAGGTPQRSAFVETMGQIGHIFIVITFGVLFAGVYAASLAALIERLTALVDLFRSFMPGL